MQTSCHPYNHTFDISSSIISILTIHIYNIKCASILCHTLRFMYSLFHSHNSSYYNYQHASSNHINLKHIFNCLKTSQISKRHVIIILKHYTNESYSKQWLESMKTSLNDIKQVLGKQGVSLERNYLVRASPKTHQREGILFLFRENERPMRE